MVKKPFFSIVIPVYNTEKYLRECLNSVSDQTFDDWEAILVDDGSTDDGLQLCEEYSQKDNRFRVFHKNNSGLFSTRLYGISRAEGRYYVGLDSDDKISAKCLETIYNAIERSNADIVSWSIETFGDEKEIVLPVLADGQVHGLHEFLVETIKSANHSMCNKAIPVAYFNPQEYDSLPSQINLSEDYAMLIPALIKAQTFYSITDALYHYRKIPGTISYTMNLKMVLDAAHVAGFVQEHLRNNSLLTPEIEKEDFVCFLSSVWRRIWGSFLTGSFNSEEADQLHDLEYYKASSEYEQRGSFFWFGYLILKLFRKERYGTLRLMGKIRKLF